MKSINQVDVIKFLKEDFVHMFGFPKSITANQGTVFVGDVVKEFAKKYKFELIRSTPYFTWANG